MNGDEALQLIVVIWLGVSLAKFTGWLPNAVLRSYIVYKQSAQARKGAR